MRRHVVIPHCRFILRKDGKDADVILSVDVGQPCDITSRVCIIRIKVVAWDLDFDFFDAAVAIVDGGSGRE